MNTVASASRAATAAGSKRENHSIGLPFSSAPWIATKSPCTWKIGSACSSTSPGAPAPRLLQHPRVAQQVAVREHRALAAAGGAARVEDGREVVGAARHRLLEVALQHGALEQVAGAVLVEHEDVLHAGLERELAHPAVVALGAHHHARLRIAHEVLDLAAPGRRCSAAGRRSRRAARRGRASAPRRSSRSARRCARLRAAPATAAGSPSSRCPGRGRARCRSAARTAGRAARRRSPRRCRPGRRGTRRAGRRRGSGRAVMKDGSGDQFAAYGNCASLSRRAGEGRRKARRPRETNVSGFRSVAYSGPMLSTARPSAGRRRRPRARRPLDVRRLRPHHAGHDGGRPRPPRGVDQRGLQALPARARLPGRGRSSSAAASRRWCRTR